MLNPNRRVSISAGSSNSSSSSSSSSGGRSSSNANNVNSSPSLWLTSGGGRTSPHFFPSSHPNSTYQSPACGGGGGGGCSPGGGILCKSPVMRLVVGSDGALVVEIDGRVALTIRDSAPFVIYDGSSNSSTSTTPVDDGMTLQRQALTQVLRWRDFTIERRLGEGGQGCVFLSRHRCSGAEFAVKVLRVKHNVTAIRQELLHVLSKCRHNNIVSSEVAFIGRGELRILMEYMNMGSMSRLLRKIGPFPEAAVAHITQQVLCGLTCLHSYGIVHRDIKPGNLLFNSLGEVKISDFGIATRLPQSPYYSCCLDIVGSHGYMSPECLRESTCSPTSDVWSLGVTMAQAVLGVYPFLPDEGVRVGHKRDSGESVASKCSTLPPSLFTANFGGSNGRLSDIGGRLSDVGAALGGGSSSTNYQYNNTSPVLRIYHGPRESGGCSTIGNTFSGNPFEYFVNSVDFSMMLQDPTVTIDFDKLVPLISRFYPHWPKLVISDKLRHFICASCVRYVAKDRLCCEELLSHPFISAYRTQAVPEQFRQWLLQVNVAPITRGY